MQETLRVLVALGLTLLLVMLRLDSQRFGAAEYDEPVDGRWPSLIRRLSWYVLGIGLIAAVLIVHPAPETDLRLTVGDRAGVVGLGLLLGIAGVAQAVALAWFKYRRIRLPEVGMYPGALANEILTAFIDEAAFRGALFGFLLWAGVPAGLAVAGQAVVYTLSTRLGGPGRDRYMFGLSLAIGLIGGWATLVTGGIGASFLGHAITRLAVFLTTGHAGQPLPRGREREDVEKRRRAPDGWRPVERTR